MVNLKKISISTIFLQVVIVFVGLIVLTLMLLEPHLEGRNTNATLFEIYFKDPFLAYVYIASISFFAGLYQALKILRYIRRDTFFSPETVKAFQIIKYCAVSSIVFVVIGEMFIISNKNEDPAGGVFIGILIVIASVTVAAIATIFEQISGSKK